MGATILADTHYDALGHPLRITKSDNTHGRHHYAQSCGIISLGQGSRYTSCHTHSGTGCRRRWCLSDVLGTLSDRSSC